MGNLRLTLYDIFGYLLPGVVFLVGLAIAVWAFSLPTAPLRLLKVPAELLGLGLVFAYICGHFAQALANLVDRSDTVLAENVEPELLKAATTQLATTLRLPTIVRADLVYQLCDEIVVQKGVRENREVYIYREGFYRGMAVSLAIFVMAVILRASCPPTYLALASGVYAVPISAYVLVILPGALGVLLLWRRYLRFARRRVFAALAGFLAVQNVRTSEAKGKAVQADV